MILNKKVIGSGVTYDYTTEWVDFDDTSRPFGVLSFSDGGIIKAPAIVDDFGVVDGVLTKQHMLDTQIDYNRAHSKLVASLISVTVNGRETGMAATDNMYCNGQLQRYDYRIHDGGDSVQELIDDIITAFPEYTDSDFKCCPADFIGRYPPYRAPYSNAGVSWYCFDSCHQDRIREEFNVNRLDSSGNILHDGIFGAGHFSGLKFDLATGTKTLKYARPKLQHNSHYLQPEVPVHGEITHMCQTILNDSDKTISPMVDCYFFSNDSDVRDYCTKWDLQYPTPSDIDESLYPPWIYGITYNDNDSAFTPGVIKSYISKTVLPT